MTGSWDLLVGWLLHLGPYDPVSNGKKNDHLASLGHAVQEALGVIFSVQDPNQYKKCLCACAALTIH